eukprot:g3545.t1
MRRGAADEVRLTRARSPNVGSFWTVPLEGALPPPLTSRGFVFRDGELNSRAWSSLADMEIVVYGSWTTARHYVAELNTSARTVTLSDNCGFAPAGMWPNSGNRYYAEAGGVEMVDAAGEWFIDRRSGVLTYCAADSHENPNDASFVLDRGEAVQEGVLLEQRTLVTTALDGGAGPQQRFNASAPLVLHADTIAWGSSSFVLRATVATTSAALGQQIFFKGERNHTHVADDKALYVDAGCALALDIGWVGHLAGKPGTIRCDGSTHEVELRFDAPSSTYELRVDGELDARASFGTADPAMAPPQWTIEIGHGWGGGGDDHDDRSFVRNVSFAFSVPLPVSQLHLEGLEVRHVGWGLQSTGNTDFQAASFLSTAALHSVNASFCTFTNVSVRHVGGMGIWVEGGSVNVTIEGSLVEDVGGGALRVGRGKPLSEEPFGARTANVTVRNSKMLRGGAVWHGGNGVLLQNSPFFTLERCEVAYFKHAAVCIGWVWGFALPPATEGNIIEHNHIHHAGMGELSDLGGIYLLGVQPGTSVRYNVVHDSEPYFLYGHGVYLDEGASGIKVEHNWVYRAFAGLFMQHYGSNNSVSHNVFAHATGDCLSFATARDGMQEHCAGHLWSPAYRGQACDYKFEHNLLVVAAANSSSGGGSARNVAMGPEGRCNASFTRNLYFNASVGASMSDTFPGVNVPSYPGYPGITGLNFVAVNASFAEWRHRGQDVGSAEADPLFAAGDTSAALGAGDFRLLPTSPAFALGFEEVDLTVGVGPDW